MQTNGAMHSAKVLSETSPDLRYLRNGNRKAISLTGILGKKVLVVVLGRIEGVAFFEGCHHTAAPRLVRTRYRGLEKFTL